MQTIKAVFFEPVGCLAEFRRDEFDRAAELLRADEVAPDVSASQVYWRLLVLMQQQPLTGETAAKLKALELSAVEHADLYEDVAPALTSLKSFGIAAYIVSSISQAAAARFVERHQLKDLLSGIVTRDDAQGVGEKVLQRATAQAGLAASEIMMLADTAEALAAAKQLGLNAMLMINDYDEGRSLAERNPAGGIVSLAELPDALKLIEQRAGMRVAGRTPRAPFELFDPS
ncbi:MAG TPA: HAD hydrolase-like protein [Xanthobacteraceae bacterium]|nr:HAD hydrolase-like protein [Xanthobacteraceae bacterium]